MHRRVASHGTRIHPGKTKLRYRFTVQDVQLVCGSAVLTPGSTGSTPTVTLLWKSGKKQAIGGVARQVNTENNGERGARWETPVRP